MSALEQLVCLVEQSAPAPPPLWLIRAHHSVPYGRAFRQWDTAGRLTLWVNRGEVADRLELVPGGRAERWGIPLVYG